MTNFFVTVAIIGFPIVFIIGIILPALGTVGTSQTQKGVEVVKAEQVGIYDVKVIKGDSSEAILDWLKENSYSFSEKDTEAFNNYVNRKWCFVTAKVNQDINLEKIPPGGMVNPLILKFKSDKAIYPLALTSAIGTETEVLLYTLSKNKLSCNERMELKYSGSRKTNGMFKRLTIDNEQETEAIFQGLPEDMIICKFKSKLTSEQMKKDLEFVDALDNEPYRERKIVW